MGHQRAFPTSTPDVARQEKTKTAVSPSAPTRPSVNPLLHLQQTVGNRAVLRLLRSGALRAKLAISRPGDVYEQEADRVAEQVMYMSAPSLQRKCASCAAGGPPCPKCGGEEQPLVQRNIEQVSDATAPTVPDNILQDLGPGQPLDTATRAFFEPRFGYDFRQTRVHSDAKAAESARALNSLAYTAGEDIVFATGQYAPETVAGQRLLAHELTHVVQQGKSRPATVSSPIHPATVSSRMGNPAIITRQVDVDETVAELTTENKDPQELEESEAAEIGEEALRTVGYEEIIRLALEAGLLERKESSSSEAPLQRQQQSPQDTIFRAEAIFWPVFSRYAVAAGIVSQLDTPAPGPGDAVALGILAVGLVAAGITVLMAKGGTQNVADTGIMGEVQGLIAAGLAATVCEALAQLLKAAQAAGDDTERIRRIQTTQKSKGCRHRGGD